MGKDRTKPALAIRRASAEDIPELSRLLYQVHRVHSDGRPDLFRAGEKKYTDGELEEILADGTRPVFVGVLDERVAGYAFCVFQQQSGRSMTDIRTLYIDDLCVDEGLRGGGIGERLYRHVLDFAAENGCYNVTLNVWACNPAALRFYEKCGLSVQKIGMEQLLTASRR
ncbi:MAG: GNAT family N-acetyltransferase [Lachnospiraceae bacterium]|nr:GNAT family N-acetyltransferase [Lachnospiraceae bacterium]